MKRNSSSKWLERSFLQGPYLTLCTNEKQFRKALKHLKFHDWATLPPLGSQHANATTHHFVNPEGSQVAIVYMPPPPAESRVDNIQVVALLAHEAVHVWQEYVASIGEKEPSREFEAYAIQTITERLLYEYRRQIYGVE